MATRPRGVPADHPRLELMRFKSLIASREHGAPAWVSTPEVVEHVRSDWRAVRPLVDWLTEHVGATTRSPLPLTPHQPGRAASKGTTTRGARSRGTDRIPSTSDADVTAFLDGVADQGPMTHAAARARSATSRGRRRDVGPSRLEFGRSRTARDGTAMVPVGLAPRKAG